MDSFEHHPSRPNTRNCTLYMFINEESQGIWSPRNLMNHFFKILFSWLCKFLYTLSCFNLYYHLEPFPFLSTLTLLIVWERWWDTFLFYANKSLCFTKLQLHSQNGFCLRVKRYKLIWTLFICLLNCLSLLKLSSCHLVVLTTAQKTDSATVNPQRYVGTATLLIFPEKQIVGKNFPRMYMNKSCLLFVFQHLLHPTMFQNFSVNFTCTKTKDNNNIAGVAKWCSFMPPNNDRDHKCVCVKEGVK